MGHEPVGRTLGADFFGCLAKGERLALREDIREQHVVLLAQRIERLREGNEIAGD